jgi:Arc/MetJ family transcription regulator
MRSTIDIDGDLLEEARELTGAKTKKDVIDISLRELVSKKRREHLAAMFGSSPLDMSPDDLEKMREDEVLIAGNTKLDPEQV